MSDEKVLRQLRPKPELPWLSDVSRNVQARRTRNATHCSKFHASAHRHRCRAL